MAKKTIALVSEIDGWGYTLEQINDGLKDTTKDDVVVIPINSYGGSVMEGTAIYNTIRSAKARTEAHIVGFAMSMGTIIALAADEVVMPENGYFMIHEPSLLKWGDADSFQAASSFLNTIGMDAAQIYAKKTGKTPEEMRALMKETTWMNAQEALEMGFVDRLSEGTEINASLDPKQFSNAPAALLSKPTDKSDKSLLSQLKTLIGLETSKAENNRSDLKSQLSLKENELISANDKIVKMETLISQSIEKMKKDQNTIAELQVRITQLEKKPAGDHFSGSEEDEGDDETPLYMKTSITKQALDMYSK